MEGGGTIDFSKYVTEGFSGTFLVGIELENIEKETEGIIGRESTIAGANRKT